MFFLAFKYVSFVATRAAPGAHPISPPHPCATHLHIFGSAGAGHRRGDPGWAVAGGIAVARADAAVSGGVAEQSADTSTTLSSRR